MTFGFGLPTRGPLARPEAIAKLAAHGEALGFDCFSFSDHIVIPSRISPVYPYSASGEPPFPADGECLEQLTLMSFVAGVTKTARLLTSVMVVPHRNPVHAAKTIATIDVLSGGRVTVGCGAGWMEEEFLAIGTAPFRERGAVTDEYLRVFKELWTSEDPSFEGKYAHFSHVKFEPKPAQKPHPPLWIGGESPAAIRRVARLGDGWFPIGANPKFPLDTPARYAAARDRLGERVAEAGRAMDEIALGFWSNWNYEETRFRTDTGERRMMSGGGAAAVDDVAALQALGVTTFMFNVVDPNSLDASLNAIQRLADGVMAKL